MTIMDVVRASEALIATGAFSVAVVVWLDPRAADSLAGALRRGAAWLALRLNARAEALRASRTVYSQVYRHVVDGYSLEKVGIYWMPKMTALTLADAQRMALRANEQAEVERLQPTVKFTPAEAARWARRAAGDVKGKVAE